MPQGKPTGNLSITRSEGQQLFPLLLIVCSLTLLSACSDVSKVDSERVDPKLADSKRSEPKLLESDLSTLQKQASSQANPVDYRTYDLAQATVHVVTIDTQADVALSVTVADELEMVSEIAQQENAIAAINAGFFDPQNSKTTSHLIFQGEIVGNPADNARLTENPSLQSYLPSILDRSEFRRYRCDESGAFSLSEFSYAIARHSDATSTGCQLDSAVGAGPQLLPTDTSTAEAFTDYENGELIRDAIGSTQPNARSAIGIISETQEVVLLMAAQRQGSPGFTLSEMSDFAQTLDVDTLLNLDGGSSSTLYYAGQTHTARLSAEGNPIERPVKSVLIVK
ncbi:MAG: phosphodiester glycosidase family protein [Cyanobacteria bacterium J06621_11]